MTLSVRPRPLSLEIRFENTVTGSVRVQILGRRKKWNWLVFKLLIVNSTWLSLSLSLSLLSLISLLSEMTSKTVWRPQSAPRQGLSQTFHFLLKFAKCTVIVISVIRGNPSYIIFREKHTSKENLFLSATRYLERCSLSLGHFSDNCFILIHFNSVNFLMRRRRRSWWVFDKEYGRTDWLGDKVIRWQQRSDWMKTIGRLVPTGFRSIVLKTKRISQSWSLYQFKSFWNPKKTRWFSHKGKRDFGASY